jgi:FMN phosphatase YigB (HAD superfamily)
VNRELMVMTLGDVSPAIADGIFDPAKDELRLKDGTVLKNYFRDTLKIKYFAPIDKTRFPLPPSGWCSWYFFYQEINEDEIKLSAKWIAENLKGSVKTATGPPSTNAFRAAWTVSPRTSRVSA